MPGCPWVFVGIDWATEKHDVCVLLGSEEKPVLQQTFPNTSAGIESVTQSLLAIADGSLQRVRIGIESPSVLIAEVLLERGFSVYSINPKQSDRFRDRHSVAGAKDDRRDAWVIARSLRSDEDCFRRVYKLPARLILLREASRTHTELTKERVRLTLKLRALLERFVPEFVSLVEDVSRAWVLSICEKIANKGPKNVLPREVRAILKRQRVRRVDTDAVVASLRADVGLSTVFVDAMCERSLTLVPRIQLLNDQIGGVDRRLRDLVYGEIEVQEAGASQQDHQIKRSAEILLSFPGVGLHVASTILAEASQAISQASHSALRLHSGVAPVTIGSGKKRRVAQRRSCDTRLRNAFFNWAKVACQRNETCGAYLKCLRQRGHGYARALRSVADKLLRALCQALRSDLPFDVERFAGSQATIASEHDNASRSQSVESAESRGSLETTQATEARSPATDSPDAPLARVSSGRLSDDVLRDLRNRFPVDRVLQKLELAAADTGGKKRRCPRCGKRQAKVNRKANLLRCFACAKNWNPIDLVMEYGRLSFREATHCLLAAPEIRPPVVGSPRPNPASRGSTAPASTHLESSQNPLAEW